MTEEKLTQTLTYAGFILVAFELAKGMIVSPIETFYENVTFGEGMPFKSYEKTFYQNTKINLKRHFFIYVTLCKQ